MLFVVFGADYDHVGDIYECPQGTYAIESVELHYKIISYTQKHKQQRYLKYKQQIIHDPI